MKRYLSTLLLSTLVYAAPVGNPAAPRLIEEGFLFCRDSCFDFRLGYEADFIADGRMKQKNPAKGRVDQFEQIANAGTLTLNFFNRVDLYGVVGGARVQSNWRYTSSDGSTHRVQMETSSDLLWGAGLRAIFYEWGRSAFGIGGSYYRANPTPLWMTLDASNISASNTTSRWSQWQVDLDFAYRIDLLTPYIGVKYSHAQYQTGTFPVALSQSGSGSISFSNRSPVGLILGCSISTGQYLMLNAEVRLVDEEAATVSGDVRF